MPIPMEYQQIREQFYDFLLSARDFANLGSTNQSYTMVQGVFQVFRRRVNIELSIHFSNVLPASIRALFVADWDVTEKQLSFTDRKTMTEEVRCLRADHNYAPDNAIEATAQALWTHCELDKLEKALLKLSKEAQEFWNPGIDFVIPQEKSVHLTWELPWHKKW